MKKGWLLLAGLVLIVGVGSYGAGKLLMRENTADRPVDRGFEMLQRYLELTPEQVGEIADIDAEFAQSRAPLREEISAAAEELESVFRKPDSTVGEAVAAAERLGEVHNDMQVNSIRYMYRMREHLTPEQKERMANVMSRGMRDFACGPGGRGPACPDGKPCPGGPGADAGGPKRGPWGGPDRDRF